MVDAVVGVLIENLDSLIKSKIGLLVGIEDDISKLSSILSTIEAVLLDAEIEKTANEKIRNWLAKLKDAAYEASDMLEEWSTNTQRHNDEGDKSGLSCLSFNTLGSRHSIAKRTKKILTRFDEIAQERLKFHLISTSVVSAKHELAESRETMSILDVDFVYGRDGDREKSIKVLLSNISRGEAVSVFTMIGMGGLGKTTLAQLVYNDNRVVEHFDVRVWVCVSDGFDVKKLAGVILESLTGQTCNIERLDTIQQQIQEILSGKKFLLVLDDVWNEDPEKWNKLKSTLKCGAEGSSILVTTRLERVSYIMSTLPPHSLTTLSKEDCWGLFKEYAFGVGKEEVGDLVGIGKQIVQKCDGLPLAVKSLGRLMSRKKKITEWEQVRDSKMWKLPQENGTDILPALRLSYSHLPSKLKQCFAFCSIYPKAYNIKKEELVHLWMANGFLQSDGSLELEDFGSVIFDELVEGSFLQVIVRDDVGDIETCKMHDLIHDLACSVSLNECGIVEVGNKSLPKGMRHCSLVFDSEEECRESVNLESLSKSNPRLRTQLVLGKYAFAEFTCRSLRFLRALDWSRTETSIIPIGIGKMKHLRYLNFSETPITLLPESICNLVNLQSLKLRDCKELEELPKETSKMKGLRHLDIRGCLKLTEMPIGMGQLTQLQTLSFFTVGMQSGRSITELGGMNHLGGEIEIKGLEDVRNPDEAREANLMSKQNIYSLSLCWPERNSDGFVAAAADELQSKVLNEGLQPHSSLIALSIQWYQGSMLPSWMAQLEKLVKISLYNCWNCEHLPPLWKLPLLKVLNIYWMKNVKFVVAADDGEDRVVGAFPKLEKLSLEFMLDLEEWSSWSLSSEEQLFPCLKELKVSWCPELKALPFLPCLQSLNLSCCDEMMLMRSPENLPRLSTLDIWRFNEMTSLPQGIFRNFSTGLTSLKIYFCKRLKSVGAEIETLTALTSLMIQGCTELDSLSELQGILHKLTSLRELYIWSSPSIKCFPLIGIQEGFQNSLTVLSIISCPNLTSLSEGLRYLTLLEKLFIIDCPELDLYSWEEGDFQHLISLRHLMLQELPQFIALPEWIQCLPMLQFLKIWECKNLRMLPEWLQRLTTLQLLSVQNCHPDVHRRCQEEDQHIISCIPQVFAHGPDYSSEEEQPPSEVGCGSLLFNKLRRTTCINN